MSATARKTPSIFGSLLQRWSDARKAKAKLRVPVHVATIRGTVYEYNPAFGYDDTYRGHAFLLEDGRGKRTVEASCRAIYRSTPVRAFLKGMSLADVNNMRGELGFTKVAPAPWSKGD